MKLKNIGTAVAVEKKMEVIEGMNYGKFSHLSFEFKKDSKEDIVAIKVHFLNLEDARITIYENMESMNDVFMLTQLKKQLDCWYSNLPNFLLEENNEFSGKEVGFLAVENISEGDGYDKRGNAIRIEKRYMNAKSFDINYLAQPGVEDNYIGEAKNKAKATRENILKKKFER